MIGKGWSITVGELRAALEGVPDDYEVMLDNAEVDDCEISNINIERLMPPVSTDSPCDLDDDDWCFKHGHYGRVHVNSPGLLVLSGGQVVSSEYAYLQRLDVWLEQDSGHWENVPRHGDRWRWAE